MVKSFVATFDPNAGKLEFHALAWNNAFDGARLLRGNGLTDLEIGAVGAGVDESGLTVDASCAWVMLVLIFPVLLCI